MKSKTKDKIRCEIFTPLDSAPNKFLVLKDGHNRGRWNDGTILDFKADRKAFEEMLAFFREMGHDMLIDYHHQSEGGIYARPDGKAPAAGWVTGLEWVDGEGMYAVSRWTKTAAEEIASGEYRYYSPVFTINDTTKRVNRLFSIALTNTPAMVDIKPLAASDESMDMPPKQLIDQLGLPENASWDDVYANIDKLKQAKPEPMPMSAAIAKALELDEKATDEQIVAKIAEIKAASAQALKDAEAKVAAAAKEADDKIKASAADPAKFVPVEAVKALQEDNKALHIKCDTLTAAAHKRECETFIESGMKAGKIVASSKEMWERVWKADSAQATKDLESAPVIVPVGSRLTSSFTPASGSGNDPIAANASNFDEGRLAHHAKVMAYKEQNKCSYEKALSVVGAA